MRRPGYAGAVGANVVLIRGRLQRRRVGGYAMTLLRDDVGGRWSRGVFGT